MSSTDDLDLVYRREAGRCVATLVRVLGDVGLAEDAVAEAFAIAVRRWPQEGFPPNPGAWITVTARNRAIDHLRREASRDQHQVAARRLVVDDGGAGPHPLDELGDPTVVPDDQLRLIFLCCHPALAPDTQVALTLRLLGGLSTTEIAKAFLVPEATMAQRLVRAKRKIRNGPIAYRIPSAEELPGRLGPVLATLYLIFTEGHTASEGAELTRPRLSAEALRLARLLVELLPDQPEAVGLLALLVLTESRRPARTGPDGALVALADQDRSRWDRALIEEGHRLVQACLAGNRPGPYQIQAAIAAVHADADDFEATDWSQIVALYDQLLRFRPDDIVGLNRAIALSRLDGPDRGLAALERMDLDDYHLFHATRAELLERLGRVDEAREAYDRASELVTNDVERRHLADRRAGLSHRC